MKMKAQSSGKFFSVAESLTNFFTKLVISVSAWIIADWIELLEVNISVVIKNLFVCTDVNDFADVVHFVF